MLTRLAVVRQLPPKRQTCAFKIKTGYNWKRNDTKMSRAGESCLKLQLQMLIWCRPFSYSWNGQWLGAIIYSELWSLFLSFLLLCKSERIGYWEALIWVQFLFTSVNSLRLFFSAQHPIQTKREFSKWNTLCMKWSVTEPLPAGLTLRKQWCLPHTSQKNKPASGHFMYADHIPHHVPSQST